MGLAGGLLTGTHTTLSAAAPNVTAQLFGSGLIGLREGLEAGIVVMVLIAFLVKSDRRDALKWVWLGVGAAVLMTVIVFLTIQYGTYTIKDLAAEAIAGVASLVAVTIVTSMVLWMRKASAGLSGELRAGMSKALETGAAAVFMLAFLAVGREGFETALFMVGYAEAETAWPLLGLLVGVLLAAAIAWGMYAGAVRIDLAKFFKYTGAFLILVAAGILSYGIGALQTVGWLPGLGSKAFDVSAGFNWSAWYGEIIQGVFNVTPTPTVLQLICWLAYLAIVLSVFLRPTRTARTPTPTSTPAPATDSRPDNTDSRPDNTETSEHSERSALPERSTK
ncbi:iron uptake transporter permease EfeU [Mycolicibacterium sp. CBM1]